MWRGGKELPPTPPGGNASLKEGANPTSSENKLFAEYLKFGLDWRVYITRPDLQLTFLHLHT